MPYGPTDSIPHRAPLAMIFYRGNQFSKEFHNRASVTFRGSWNRLPPSGYKLIYIDFENGKPKDSGDFFSGFFE